MIVKDAAMNHKEEEGDVWDEIMRSYKQILDDEWNRLVVAYDVNQDNNLDELENRRGFNQVRLNR